MTDFPKQAGAGLNVIPSLAVLEAIERGLGRLRQNQDSIEEMVDRDDNLRLGSQSSWTRELREALLEMMDPQSVRKITVGIGHPPGPESFPFVSVVQVDGGENVSDAVAGDELHRAYTMVRELSESPTMGRTLVPTSGELADDEHLAIRHSVSGTGMTSRIQVLCWATADERAEVIMAAVRWALWEGRGLLQQRGIHEVTWQEGGAEPSEQLAPRVTWLPMLMVSLQWTFRRTQKQLVPNRVRISGGAFQSGAPSTESVPQPVVLPSVPIEPYAVAQTLDIPEGAAAPDRDPFSLYIAGSATNLADGWLEWKIQGGQTVAIPQNAMSFWRPVVDAYGVQQSAPGGDALSRFPLIWMSLEVQDPVESLIVFLTFGGPLGSQGSAGLYMISDGTGWATEVAWSYLLDGGNANWQYETIARAATYRQLPEWRTAAPTGETRGFAVTLLDEPRRETDGTLKYLYRATNSGLINQGDANQWNIGAALADSNNTDEITVRVRPRVIYISEEDVVFDRMGLL